MDKLTKGTTIVVATGVMFDLWVSLWLVNKPDTHVTRLVTISIVTVLITGLAMMAIGYTEQKNNPPTTGQA
ncbi:MAG: hypothetical protein ACRDUW_03395 [Pseudonocardiaceae bacterium]